MRPWESLPGAPAGDTDCRGRMDQPKERLHRNKVKRWLTPSAPDEWTSRCDAGVTGDAARRPASPCPTREHPRTATAHTHLVMLGPVPSLGRRTVSAAQVRGGPDNRTLTNARQDAPIDGPCDPGNPCTGAPAGETDCHGRMDRTK